MHAKGIEEVMNNYFMQLSLAEKRSVVQMIKTFLQRSDKEMSPTALDEYNKDIDESMAEIARGEVYSHDEIVKMSKKW